MERTLYDNYDIYSDENMKEAKENIMENEFLCESEDGTMEVVDNYGKTVKVTREEYEKTITDDRLHEECRWLDTINAEDLEGELSCIARYHYGEVVAIADIGRWDGRCGGYKLLDSIKDVLYSSCDYVRIFVDSYGNLRKSESHHDGSNSILYRFWKDGLTEAQKENFLDRIYSGKVTRRDITRYTSSCGKAVAEHYGWTTGSMA